MRYIPLTASDREEMLNRIGSSSIEDLFSSIPSQIRHGKQVHLPAAKTEQELKSYFSTLSERNLWNSKDGWASFLGGGCYEHFIPTVVDALSSRGEFVTAYTPYQPEVSQGTLQAIFEFQSMVSALFGMDVANASMYDGASSLAEATMMAMRVKRKGTNLYVSKGIHPDYLATVRSYLTHSDIHIIDLEVDDRGRTDLSKLKGAKDAVAVVVQQPNFYGVVEDLNAVGVAAREIDAMFTVATTEAMAFGLLKAPGDQGADIVVGEGQSFGNYPSYGGPHVGLFSTRKEYLRQLPGRLVGKTVDQDGKEGYVLTLAAREQHIRRERATSNICTNHSLCALRAAMHMAVIGEQGICETARKCAVNAHKLHKGMLEINGVESVYSGPFYHEFTLRLPISSDAFLSGMEDEKVLAGIPLSRWSKGRPNDLLVAVTEMNSEVDIERYLSAARKVL